MNAMLIPCTRAELKLVRSLLELPTLAPFTPVYEDPIALTVSNPLKASF
jgi:hypothetical protein